MQSSRKVLLLLLSAFMALWFNISNAYTPSVIATDTYDFALQLKVPQVIKNSASLGKRIFKKQHIKGSLLVYWMADGTYLLGFSDLSNSNFRVHGIPVSYGAAVGNDVVPSRYCYIGDNKKNTFKQPCITFYLELEPSYAINEISEDNGFFLLLSGTGKSKYDKKSGARVATSFSGYAAGTQGCGCMEYSHKSPTRTVAVYGPTEDTTDVVASYGAWKARWKSREGWVQGERMLLLR